jgi:uncharacterized membrane protein YfcA
VVHLAARRRRAKAWPSVDFTGGMVSGPLSELFAVPLIEVGVLLGAAFATSILSAVVGMAGGIVLLTIMLFFFDPIPAIAIHGVVQLASNSSRAVIQREHVAWDLVGRYAILLLPMGYAGVQIAFTLPPHLTKALIGLFVLVATWRPDWLLFGADVDRLRPRVRFFFLGGFMGFMSTIVGATGPLQAPFFLRLGLTRHGIVGTKAACQSLSHVSKTIVLGAVGFAFVEHVPLIAAMAVMVIAGTWVGSQLLERVNERAFLWIFKSALTLIAIRFILWDGWYVLAQLKS